MENKITWEEIIKNYPDQWVSLDQVEQDESGRVISAVVTASGPDLGSVAQVAKGQEFINHKFQYTGRIKPFLGLAKWTFEDAQVD